MIKRLAGVVATAFLGAGLAAGFAAPASATTAHHSADASSADFHAELKLDNCSGSLVRLPGSADTDKALAMTNGHCYDINALGPGKVVTDKPATRTFGLLDAQGTQKATLTSTKLAYATMTDTDVAVYELSKSYADIKAATNIEPLTVSDQHPTKGQGITVASGYFTEKWSCSIDSFVYRLKEADWTWQDSIKYTPECTTKHGTSGSPIIADDGKTVVGINNTGNDDGAECTLNNPCEVDESGAVSVHQGQNYGEQTHLIPGCFGAGNQLDLTKSGCALPKD